MQNRFAVASSPHLRDDATTRRVMTDVCIALLPAALAGIWFFGLRAGVLMLVSVAGAVVSEWIFNSATHKPQTTGDMSAVVTGLLLAFNLPASSPWWMAAAGSAFAIILVKQFFGGLGQNFMNPALAARVVLTASWAGLMTAWVPPQAGQWLAGWGTAADAVSGATPLAVEAGKGIQYGLWDLFVGNVPGTLGETSKLALLLGGVYLLWRRVINWRIPVCFIACFFALTWLQTGVLYSQSAGAESAVYQLLSGGLILGAVFMATDYSSAPVTAWGQIAYGAGCGVILFLFRAYHAGMVEGCSFAILLMNVASPLIERATMPRAFGEVKGNG